MKGQWGNTTHTLEWLKFFKLTIQSVDNDKDQLKFSYTADGNENDATPLENSLLVFYKVKLYLPHNTVSLSRSETKFYSQKKWEYMSTPDLYVNIHSA